MLYDKNKAKQKQRTGHRHSLFLKRPLSHAALLPPSYIHMKLICLRHHAHTCMVTIAVVADMAYMAHIYGVVVGEGRGGAGGGRWGQGVGQEKGMSDAEQCRHPSSTQRIHHRPPPHAYPAFFFWARLLPFPEDAFFFAAMTSALLRGRDMRVAACRCVLVKKGQLEGDIR